MYLQDITNALYTENMLNDPHTCDCSHDKIQSLSISITSTVSFVVSLHLVNDTIVSCDCFLPTMIDL